MVRFLFFSSLGLQDRECERKAQPDFMSHDHSTSLSGTNLQRVLLFKLLETELTGNPVCGYR